MIYIRDISFKNTFLKLLSHVSGASEFIAVYVTNANGNKGKLYRFMEYTVILLTLVCSVVF